MTITTDSAFPFELPELPANFQDEFVERPPSRMLVETLAGTTPGREWSPRKVFLAGAAGTGKTWLALRLAHDADRTFSKVFFARGRDLSEDTVNDLRSAVARWRSPLLIVDAVDEASPTVQRDLIGHVGMLAAVLCTGRNASFPTDRRITLSGFELAEMFRLARKILPTVLPRNDVEALWERFRGNPALVAAALKAYKLGTSSWDDVFSTLAPISTPGLVDLDGRPLSHDSREYRTIVSDVRGVSREVLLKLASQPEELYRLSPRFFEEVVAEIFKRMNYEVTLTPSTRDGGKDIYAVKKDSVGSFLYLVECKRYGPERHVGVELIRSLYGVVEEERATAGILATTSDFTAGARAFQKKVEFRIALQNYVGLQKWLKDVTQH